MPRSRPTRRRVQHVAGFGHPSERPVFIVGVPRSGTTLVAQILSAHPEVSTAGELEDMPAIAGELSRLDRATVQTLAVRYLRRLDQVGGPGVRVIDKLPENYFHLGLIATLFPGARILPLPPGSAGHLRFLLHLPF